MRTMLRKLFCSHPALQSVDTGDYRVEYSSPLSIMGTKVRKYACKKCSDTYYRTGGDQAEREVQERFYEYLNTHPL